MLGQHCCCHARIVVLQGNGTADVRAQDAHIGPGSGAEMLAWKAGNAVDESAYSSLPGTAVSGRPILGVLPLVKLHQHTDGCLQQR